MDRALARRLEARFAECHARARPGSATTRPRSGSAPGDLVDVLRSLHDEPDLGFTDARGPGRGGHGHGDAGRLPPLERDHADWLRVIVEGLSRDEPRIPSVTFLWQGAEWMERETYDMFGIIFEGNRDLRRIYMPPDYTSFPLRKDFYLPGRCGPLAGRRRPPHGADKSPVDAAPGVLRRTGA